VRIPFRSSPRSSVGIEWELEIVDPSTRQLASEAPALLEELGRGYPQAVHPKAKYELLQCTVEIITGVCESVPEAKADLAGTLAQVGEVAGHRGLAMMCSGTHPLSDWAAQKISPDPRYAKLVDEMQWPARRLQIFGVHVHVGVRGADRVIPIVNALTSYIPHFLALSASSPYWKGRDTGLASCRSKVFESLPTAGLPYQLSGWEEFEEFMQTLVSSKTIESIREVWWDVRPHPNFGTVELRICDGLPTLREVGAMAALSQCLVDRLSLQIDRGDRLPTPRSWIVRENKWRAARHGLDAQIISADSGETQDLREAVEELVEELRPVADRLGCLNELDDTRLILAAGASYERQRAAAAASGGVMTAVVDSLLREMRTDTPDDMSDFIGSEAPRA